MSETKTDIYTTVTNKILADLENGNLPWHKSWNGGDSLALPLRWNGESYNGINIIMLWCSSMAKGYKSRTWMTFKQALELGAAVRKGEKGSPVVYANAIMKNELNEKTGSEEERAIHYLKSYTVFNVEQIDGLPDRFKVSEQPQFTNPDDRNAALDSYFKATGADIRHGGTRAFFAPQPDFVQMPEFKDFESAEAYYSVLAHEMTHWTGHKARLAREQNPQLLIDGPLQYDAAAIASVGRQKAPNSQVAGRATVFVFPDLNTGNTTYKAVQRSADCVSVGPMLQGLRKPVNDLSRGALVDDIVFTIALTAIQAASQAKGD